MAQGSPGGSDYPDHATATITFDPSTADIDVRPPSLRVRAGGTLRWKCTGGVESFEIVMKDSSRTPFPGGRATTRGVTETPDEPVDERANGGADDAANTYRYTVICTDDEGNRHELDPDVVVGPPLPD